MIELYDRRLAFLGPADHVIRWGYEEKHNDISTATMVLPSDAEANERIDVGASYARLYDGETDLGFYRFSKIVSEERGPGGTVTYELQHSACTLADRMLSGWHEIGGTGYSTREAAAYTLDGQEQWRLGECEFEAQFQYNFEDVTRLEALMSLGEVLTEDYRYDFDSTASPWTVHLRRIEETPKAALVYRRTMTAIRRSVDGRVVTRLYGRGYGEGDNQLTIAAVNGGLDYIDAPDEIVERYGVREGVHVDPRQTDASALKARMERILEAGMHPTVSYEAEAIDLYRLTGEKWDHVAVGTRVLILDETLGPVSVLVKSRKKDDAQNDPGAITYVLDNARRDTAEELNEILDKIGVHELYSQGATNMYSMQIADNADAEHPLTMRFYVPGNVLRINSCLIYWAIEAFRTYTTLTKDGGGGTRTSESGGGATVTLPERTLRVEQSSGGAVDQDGGGMNNTGESSAANTGTGGSGNTGVPSKTHTAESDEINSSLSGGHSHKVNSHNHSVAITMPGHGHTLGSSTTTTGGISGGAPTISGTTGDRSPDTNGVGDHSHTIGKHSHGLNAHQHAVTGHNHSMAHTHPMDHLHSITHEHVIPSMSFELEAHSHTLRIPEHTHELKYGVYEGGRATGLSLVVDGEPVPAEAITQARELDVAAFLRKNDDGKVTRSAWHEVKFVPDGLTRITADLFFQVFIQSRGAGDY